VDRNFTSQASRPFVLRTPGCRNAEISWTGTSQVKHPVPSSFEPPVAEMPKCPNLFLRDFTKSSKGYLFSFEPRLPKCRNVPAPIPSGFHVSRNQGARDISAPWNPRLPKCRNVPAPILSGFHFTKSGCKGYLCSLESPVAEMPKCRNALAFDQWLTIIPGIYGPRPTSLFRYFTIRGLGDKDLCPSNSRYPKSRNGPTVQSCL
jgi:hypothetical protein